MANCSGILLMFALIGVLCCTIKVDSILLEHEHFLPAALDAVLSPYHHWRGRRSAITAEASHGSASGEVADAGDPCQTAVGHLGAACLQVLKTLPGYMDTANVTMFVQAVEMLCDSSACIEGLNGAVEACRQVETHTNHSASHTSVGGGLDSSVRAFVTANLSSLLHLGCLRNSKGHRCFGVLYRYQEREISCALDLEGTNEHVCTASCQQNVSQVLDTVGCCYNSYFDVISSGSGHESHLDVWRVCNVSDPGTCEVSSGFLVTDTQPRNTMLILLMAVTVGNVGLHG